MSRVTVRIPTPLRSFTLGADEVSVEGTDVRQVLLQVVSEHRGLDRQLFDADGELREFVNVFLGDRNIRSLDGLDSRIESAAVVNIVPAVAGGNR